MIISASRRTDIPAFYSEWFMNRVRESYCSVVNPMNAKQVQRVSLKVEDVDAIVFWTKNPRPMMTHLKELNERYDYYFFYTLNSYPHVFEPDLPSLDERIDTFRELSGILGSKRVIWRFDPIIISSITDYQYIAQQFNLIASKLNTYTERVVISYVDEYRAAGARFRKLQEKGLEILTNPEHDEKFRNMVHAIRTSALKHGMKIESCAENFVKYSISLGKCIDNELINHLFNKNVPSRKDRSQRKECRCIAARDIGFYDSCRHNCIYCYATGNGRKTLKHDPASPSLLGRFDTETPIDRQLLIA